MLAEGTVLHKDQKCIRAHGQHPTYVAQDNDVHGLEYITPWLYDSCVQKQCTRQYLHGACNLQEVRETS